MGRFVKVQVLNFSYGPLTPGLGYLMSCLGCFLGLRCATRAQVYEGAARIRWLVLAGVAIGTTGIWTMHFIAMLGFTIPGQQLLYNVPVTLVSMVIAVAVVVAGLLIAGLGKGMRPLLLGGLVIGCGVAIMHYLGMAALEVPDRMRYNVPLVAASVAIAVVAGTAALIAAMRLQSLRATLGASLVMGLAVSAMHYTGIAAFNVCGVTSIPGAAPGSGITPGIFLLPVILGISILALGLTIVISFAPTGAEILEERALLERIARRQLPH
jgi:NO-binding membrane sensor protein with MHYT domain